MPFICPRPPSTPHRPIVRPAPGEKILRGDDLAAWKDAQGMLQAARLQADDILLQARRAFEEERRRGYAAGEHEARLKQAEKIMETVGQSVDYLARFEHEIIELVMRAIRKIIDGFSDEDKVMAVTRNALAIVRNQKQITLRLNPDQVESVRRRVNELLAAFPVVGYIDILEDTRVAYGACILESEVGLVEADLEGQIDALRTAFERILGSRI